MHQHMACRVGNRMVQEYFQDFLIMTVLFDLKKVDGEIQSSQHENFGPLDVQTKPVHMSQAVHFHGKSGHAR